MFASVAERIKAVVPGDRDTKATLEESLRQLRGLVEEIVKREKFLNDSLRLLNERLQGYERIGGPLDAALKGDDIEAVRTALDKLDTRPSHAELLREQVKTLSRAAAMQIPRDTFLHDHHEAKSVLTTMCEHRLSEARANLKRVTVQEQGRLDSLGEGYDSSHSPVVKRANARVVQLEGMLSNIENASPESLQTAFVNYGQQLLNHE
jgi:hypothetical protein